LLNLAGQVVGINTATIPSAHGIGFAIAINTAKPILRELMATGRIVRSSLGLVAVSVTPQLAYANDLPIERGVLVLRLEEESPAGSVGVEPGDVITALGGRPVRELGITVANAYVRLHRARRALLEGLRRVCGACLEHGCLDCTCRKSRGAGKRGAAGGRGRGGVEV